MLGRYLAEFLDGHLEPSSYYRTGRGWNTNTIRLTNGSIIQLRSYEDRPDAHAGDSLDIVWLDEPPPRSIFTESQARVMDRDGEVWLTLTPVGRPVAWLRDMIEREGSVWEEVVIPFSQEACPWYDEAQVAQWLEDLSSSPWEYEQRVNGSWEGVTLERLFTGLSEDNIREPGKLPPDLCVGITIDHGATAGSQVALLVLWEQRGRRMWVIDEYVSEKASSPEEDAAAIRAMLRRHRIKPSEVDEAVGDTNVSKGYAGYKLNDVLEQEFARMESQRLPPFRILGPDKTPGSVDWGLRVVNHALRRGDLVVHPRCVNLSKTLRHWKGSKTGDDGTLCHAADALRYFAVAVLGKRTTYARLRFT